MLRSSSIYTSKLGIQHNEDGSLKDNLRNIKRFFLLLRNSPLFRRICGPKYVDGERKSRMNRELEELSKKENIVKSIKGQRISWLGHLERMEEMM